MEKTKHKQLFMIIGILLFVIILVIAIVVGFIYYSKPIYKNNILKIYRSDKFYLSNMAGTAEGEGTTKTEFNNSNKKVVYNFLKQLKVTETSKEPPPHNPGLPPVFRVDSHDYTAVFELWSSHAVTLVITYKDKFVNDKHPHYYEFTVPANSFNQLMRLLDKD